MTTLYIERMKSMKKPSMISILLLLTGLLCIFSLLFFNKSTLEQIISTEKEVDAIIEQFTDKQTQLQAAAEKYTSAVDTIQSNIHRLQQKQQTASQKVQQEKAEILTEDTSKPSIFTQQDDSSDLSADPSSIFSSETSANGHIVGIDPGHQSETVDMSALEPNGPGSSEMKAKCTGGTQGSYTGLPEYQLNLDVSLLLKDILEKRGYQVVMTRTDNETAISNKERAQYAAAEGADIYVRIHANGDDTHTVSGALSMSPSQNNPYVPQLFESSNLLSQCIIDSYCNVTGFRNLGVQYYDNMTGINWSTVPVTILEMGFMTHPDDDQKMADPSFQQTMAEGIADGIDAYFATVQD